MPRIPRFALLLVGIALAGAGAAAVNLGHPSGWIAAVAGVAIAAAEFAPLERAREKRDTQLELDLRALKVADKPEGIDEDWEKKQFGGPGSGT